MEDLNFEHGKKWKDTKLGMELLGDNTHELIRIPQEPPINKELLDALKEFVEQFFALAEEENNND